MILLDLSRLTLADLDRALDACVACHRTLPPLAGADARDPVVRAYGRLCGRCHAVQAVGRDMED